MVINQLVKKVTRVKLKYYNKIMVNWLREETTFLSSKSTGGDYKPVNLFDSGALWWSTRVAHVDRGLCF